MGQCLSRLGLSLGLRADMLDWLYVLSLNAPARIAIKFNRF